MTNDRSKQSEQDLKLPVEAEATPLSGDQFGADLRGFGPVGILAILVIILSGNVFAGNIIIPIGGSLVLLWVRLSHTPWREIGYVRPKSWIGATTAGIILGISFKVFMKMIVLPLLGADPINQAYHYLAGNRAMLPAALWAMIVAGFAEETVFRGFLFERFGKLFAHGAWVKALIVLLTSVLFGLAHYRVQGLAGVEQATIVGLLFGTIFAITGRIWILMIAHAAFDLASLAIIYLNLESDVAHLIFK